MRNVKVIEVVFVRDNLDSCDERVDEARNLIAQMIEASHRRGRPEELVKEAQDAA